MNELYFDTTDEEEKDKKELEKLRRPKDIAEQHEINDAIRQEEKIVELQIAGLMYNNLCNSLLRPGNWARPPCNVGNY